MRQNILVNTDLSSQHIISNGEIVACRLTPTGSNYTFLAQIQLGEATCLAIYKPRDGESPLWDFPRGTLYKREYAAYLLSQVLGWTFIPFTIIRDGPYGIGTVQEFVDHDPKQNYYTLTEATAEQLKTVACFDLLANSTDRKPNHLILDSGGKLWSIDHGLTFHSDTKIRTVIWDFCGEKIPEYLLERVRDLEGLLAPPKGLTEELMSILPVTEIEALRRRVAWVLNEGVYPGLPGRNQRM